MNPSALVASFSVSLFALSLCGSEWHAAEAQQVSVAEVGNEPLEALQYSVAQDGEWLLFIDRALDQKLFWEGKPMNAGVAPGFRFRISVRNAEAPEGIAISLELSKFSVELIPTADTKPEMLKALEAYWTPIEKVELTLLLDVQGVLNTTVLKTPEGMSPFLQDDLGKLVQTIRSLIVPLPTEPVGVGGIWTEVASSKYLQFAGTKTSRFTLTSTVDGILELAVQAKRDFPRQSVKAFHNPDLETLHYFKGSEDKTVRLSHASLFPLFTHAEGTSDAEVDNLLGMLAKNESSWKIEAGVVSPKGGDEAWAKMSHLFPATVTTSKKD